LAYGRVIGVERGLYAVETASGLRLACRLRGKLAKVAATAGTTAPVVVGDRVLVRVPPHPGGAGPGEAVAMACEIVGQIEQVLGRTTVVSRRAPGPEPKEHILAANIGQAAVVVSLAQPRFKVGTVSQFVTGAAAGGAEPLIILNKVDLAGARDMPAAALEEALADLEAFGRAGVRYVLTSTVTGEGIGALREALSGRWTLFYGQSGVGKSSLLNAIRPDAAARVGAVSEARQKGKHTTTSSRLYPVDGGGYVIDTPGIRAFGFWSAPARDGLNELFPEIADLAAGCRFADCSHAREPGCAVMAALERGDIDRDRYRQYVRLARSAARSGEARRSTAPRGRPRR
jgi:ribosome biogenesis GTPase